MNLISYWCVGIMMFIDIFFAKENHFVIESVLLSLLLSSYLSYRTLLCLTILRANGKGSFECGTHTHLIEFCVTLETN